MHCSLCFVLTCKQWSVWCPICAICSVCSVGSGVFGGRLGMRRAEFPGARVRGGGAVCVPPYTVQSTVTVQYFTTLYCRGGGGGSARLHYAVHCTSVPLHIALQVVLAARTSLLFPQLSYCDYPTPRNTNTGRKADTGTALTLTS